MIVSVALPKDVSEIAALYAGLMRPDYIAYGEIQDGLADVESFFPGALEKFKVDISKNIDNQDVALYVARNEKDEPIVGFIYANIKLTLAGNKECWILDMGVLQDVRKRGVGTALIEKIFLWGAGKKVNYFVLESGIRNKEAHGFFEKLGFAPISKTFLKKNSD